MPKKGSKISEATRQRMRDSWKQRDPHPCLTGKHGLSEETIRAEFASGKLWCGSCRAFLGAALFGQSKSKKRCLACQSKFNKANYLKHRDSKLESRKAYYRANLEAEKSKRKKWFFKNQGASRSWYDQTLEDQGGGCAICGSNVPDSRSAYMFVDHRHECCPPRRACDKCRRGLLCGRCNSSLERVESDPEWGIKALAYLARYSCLSESS